MDKKYQTYINNVIANISADYSTREKIKQSLAEHIDVLIEKHGSLAYKELDPPEKVAHEFSENLGLNTNQEKIDYYPWWVNHPHHRKISDKKIFNIPLYHITNGYNPRTGKFEVAKGIFAVGPIACGVFSLGGLAFGLFSFGGLSIGLLIALGGAALSLIAALGGFAIGGLLAVGGLAVSYGISIGGLAIGHVAIGDDIFGKFIYDTKTGEGNAVEWFRKYLPYFVKYFK